MPMSAYAAPLFYGMAKRSGLIVNYYIERSVYEIDAVNYTPEEYKEAPLS